MPKVKSPLGAAIERRLSYVSPQIIAIDDWMVWGRQADGTIVECCAETWPEWLDQVKAPEDMENDEYRKAVLKILRYKRPHWVATFSEHRFSNAEEIQMIQEYLKDLEAKQAAFIAANL